MNNLWYLENINLFKVLCPHKFKAYWYFCSKNLLYMVTTALSVKYWFAFVRDRGADYEIIAYSFFLTS